jgi:hypothetical protein
VDKISWTECVKNKEVLRTVKEERNILCTIKKESQLDWLHITHIVEGGTVGRIKVMLR